jgi:hypothetical protein
LLVISGDWQIRYLLAKHPNWGDIPWSTRRIVENRAMDTRQNTAEAAVDPALIRSPAGAASPERRPSRTDHRSAVTNGKRLHVVRPGDTAWARRFRDVLAEITNDLGGADLLSEGQRQLARRCATISIACEKMEGVAASGGEFNLEEFGRLTDRLGRGFQRLGLRRQPRDVGLLDPLEYARRVDAHEATQP